MMVSRSSDAFTPLPVFVCECALHILQVLWVSKNATSVLRRLLNWRPNITGNCYQSIHLRHKNTCCAFFLCRPNCSPEMSSCPSTSRHCSSVFTSPACGQQHSAAQNGIFTQPNSKLQLPGNTKWTLQKRPAVQESKHAWRQQRPHWSFLFSFYWQHAA